MNLLAYVRVCTYACANPKLVIFRFIRTKHKSDTMLHTDLTQRRYVTHTPTHTPTHTHTDPHTHKHTHKHTRTPTHTHTNTHTPTHKPTHTPKHKPTQTHPHTHTNSVSIKRRVTKVCPQGSCRGPGFCNLLYSSLLKLELTSNSKIITFADDVILLTRRESVVEAENYMNLEMRKILKGAKNNKLKFNENKSKVTLMSRSSRRERKEIEIYVNNKTLKQLTV